jgi:hypothetical protein
VDIHAVFPNFAADADKPESYDFLRTDEYLRTVLATAARSSIASARALSTAKTGGGVTRRQTSEMGDGLHEHRAALQRRLGERLSARDRLLGSMERAGKSAVVLDGYDEDYYRLYAATAKAIKAKFPDVKVGGPSGGNVVVMEKGS